jgi:hypothetical protein
MSVLGPFYVGSAPSRILGVFCVRNDGMRGYGKCISSIVLGKSLKVSSFSRSTIAYWRRWKFRLGSQLFEWDVYERFIHFIVLGDY